MDIFVVYSFAVDTTTGILSVAQSKALDRETQDTYSLTVEVVDKGGLRSSVDVTVNVTDVNDNAPEFNRVEYSANLREGALHFDRPLLIQVINPKLSVYTISGNSSRICRNVSCFIQITIVLNICRGTSILHTTLM